MQYRQYYRKLRNELGLPASVALAWARGRQALEERIADLGIEWEDRNGHETAHWSQDGFDLVAALDTNPEDWWIFGEDDYGRFSDRWQPGSVRHSDNPREFRWFIPADPSHPHECYRKAKDYGYSWWYVLLEVKAFRYGVLLAEESVGGYEYDLNVPVSERELVFSQVALELAGPVIAQANAMLKQLCADQPCAA